MYKREKLIVYDYKEERFESNGVALITDYYNIEQKEVFNGEISMVFYMAFDDPKLEFVEVDRFIKAYGILYIVKTISNINENGKAYVGVECEHIAFELLDDVETLYAHRQSTAQFLLDKALEGTRFVGYADSSFNKAGGYNLQVSKGTKTKILNELCENLDGFWKCNNEVDSDGNFRIDVLPSDGQIKGFLVHNRKNLNKIKRTVDSTELCTRLYCYGQEDLTFENYGPAGGKMYIDSEYINDYKYPKETIIKFDSIIDQASLYQAGIDALAQLEKPIVTYEAQMQDLVDELKDYTSQDHLQLGDVIFIVDEILGINTKAKVTEITRKPIENSINVKFNIESSGIEDIISNIVDDQDTITGTAIGNVWEQFVAFDFTNDIINVIFDQNYVTLPVIVCQLIGLPNDHSNPPIIIDLIDEIANDTTIYTGCTIHVPNGTADQIHMRAIGRFK